MRPGKRRALSATPWGELMERIVQTKACQSRACLPCGEGPVWPREDALPWAGEEQQAVVHPVWPGQSGAGAQVVVGA